MDSYDSISAFHNHKVSGPVHLYFDSASTTHLTPHRNIVTDIVSCPQVEVATASKSSTVIIRERGKVQLAEGLIMLDVAISDSARVSLISMGRLVEAYWIRRS